MGGEQTGVPGAHKKAKTSRLASHGLSETQTPQQCERQRLSG